MGKKTINNNKKAINLQIGKGNRNVAEKEKRLPVVVLEGIISNAHCQLMMLANLAGGELNLMVNTCIVAKIKFSAIQHQIEL